MNQCSRLRWVAPTACIAFATLFSGCATDAAATAANDARFVALNARLEESERQNGRMTVRIEELEDQIFLLQDRVEANRLALQRKGAMRSTFDQPLAQAPQPAPETYYNGGNYRTDAAPQTRRNVTRIPIYEHDPYAETYEHTEPTAVQTQPANEPELVITDKEYDAFVGNAPRTTRPSQGSGEGQKREAQPPVTSERLATSEELKTASVSQLEQPRSEGERQKSRDALGIYKDSLTSYRAGQYEEALSGFQSFLDSKPRADYVDNTLYWLGECEFGLERFDSAVSYFQRVISEQPDGNKVPDAMLKMSLAYERLGKPEQAKKTLQQLTTQYPSSNAGQLGLQKLNEM